MDTLLSITVGKQLERVADTYPDREAVKYTDRPYRRTWREFDEEVNRVARGFIAHGIKKGDKIAIWATNIPEWLLTFFASSKIGAILVTVNTAYRVFELEYQLQQSDTKLLVMSDRYKDTDYVEIARALFKGLGKAKQPLSPMLPCLREVIYAGPGETPEGMTPFCRLQEDGKAVPEEEFRRITDSLDPHDVVNMQYTSGTTGFPKGVMLTHYNIVNNGLGIGDRMKFTHEDKLCIVVPFFHCFGMVLAVMACLTHASSMVPVDVFSPVKVMEALEKEECTAYHGVPTMFIAILDHPDFPKYRFPKLRTGIMAGSPCPVKVMEAVIEKMGAREITITYGLTETSPASTMTATTDSILLRTSTVGRAMPFVETRIVDPETGAVLGPGQIGEFCSRGYNTMKGYYKMEEATAQVLDKDGWLHSGDLATVDENGYYSITGRIKDMIIRGGENIYPKEIEEFLYTVSEVQDVQVIGVPSERYGEEVMACVILKEPGSCTEEQLKEVMRASMARHKVPRYIAFVKEFPMTASGKIQKYKLREWAVERLQLDKTVATV